MRRFWKTLDEVYVRLLVLFFGFILLIGVWQAYDNYYIFDHALDKSVLKYKPDPSNPEATADSPITKEMVGWITLDGTDIDYPVMQGENNAYFLNTDPFGGYSLTGSIFLDSRSSPDFSDDYSVIYGHHMDYGKMFGALDDYLNASYLEKHSSGTLMIGRNAEKVCGLEVFASARASAREKIVFDMQSDKIGDFIRDNASVLTDAEPEGRRILCLSTCAEAGSVTRIVVFCYIND